MGKFYLLLAFIFLFHNSPSQELTRRDSIRIDRLEIKLNRALASHQRYEARVAEGDSLIAAGLVINDAAVYVIDTLSQAMQQRLSEYNAEYRKLKRQQKSNSAEEANQARIAIRDLDRSHSASVRQDDAILRQYIREATQGSRLIERGDKIRKSALKSMRKTQRGINSAKKELDNTLKELNLAGR